MTSAEITQMISTDSFTAAFSPEQRERIKALWIAGRIREAQQEAQNVLEKPAGKRERTLL